MLIFHTYFSGKNVVPPKVDWAPTPMTVREHFAFLTALCYYLFVCIICYLVIKYDDDDDDDECSPKI